MFSRKPKQFQDCPICLEQIFKSKSLPCRHTFCKECIEQLIFYNCNQADCLKCPLCRQVVPLYKNKLKLVIKCLLFYFRICFISNYCLQMVKRFLFLITLCCATFGLKWLIGGTNFPNSIECFNQYVENYIQTVMEMIEPPI